MPELHVFRLENNRNTQFIAKLVYSSYEIN